MNAADVLRDMVRQYAAFDSYRDTGFVTTKFFAPDVVNRMAFSTLYRRPGLFRFTFFRPHPYPPLAHIMSEHTAGFDGSEGYVLKKGPRDNQAVKQVMPLKFAIAATTGISKGSAHTIGRLLLPDVEGLSVLDLVNPCFNPETVLDGAACYAIAARLPMGAAQELWIEKDTLLLRKVVELSETVRSEEVRENIHVNEVLEARLFAA